ncbi:MAG TPA: hypothetical protein VIG06_00375 [Kofleriaceae bacterium]
MTRARGSPLLLLILAAAGCGDNSAHGPGPHPAFELEGDPVPVSGVPFPNDLYKDEEGELEVPVSAMPFGVGADPEIMANVSAAFAELDCFGPGGGVIFPLRDVAEGDDVDETTLTGDTLLLVDLATGSRLPTEHHVRVIEDQIFVRPRRGTVLAMGATYAAVLTTGVALTSGRHLAAATELEEVLAGTSPSAAATRAYAPLRASPPVPPGSIAGAAVFTTCDYDADFTAVLDDFDSAEPPVFTASRVWRGAELDELLGTPADDNFPGVDNPGGIAHADIGFVVAGSFLSPNYQSDTPGLLGVWHYDAAGAPVVQGMDEVPVLLVIPADIVDHGALPVVLFQHGLGESKTAVLALANTLAARGVASISIDIPFHGGRYPEAEDDQHNFGGGEGPDGLADPTGILAAPYFFDLFGDDAAAPLDPRVQTASFRQAAIDVIALTRLVDGGDWSAVGAMSPALDDLGFRADRMVYASESFGGFIGLLAVAYEPRLQAAFLSVAGGGLLGELLENSPTYAPFFMPILSGAFDVAPNEVDPLYDPAHSHWAYQMMSLLLGSADPLTYAARLKDKGVHIVLANAFSDESVPNQSSEALAAALGLPWADVPDAVDGPRYLDSMEHAALPVEDGRAYFELDPASHGMITRGRGDRSFEPGFPPFVGLAEPESFDNPIVQLQSYLTNFAVTYVTDGTPVLSGELSLKTR